MRLVRIAVCCLLAAGLASCVQTSTYTVGWGDTASLTFKSREAALRAEQDRIHVLGKVLAEDGYTSISDSKWIVNPKPSHGGRYAAHKLTVLEAGPPQRRHRVEITSEVVNYPEPHEFEWKFHVHYSISKQSRSMSRGQAGEPEDVELMKLKATHKDKHPFVQQILDMLGEMANKEMHPTN